MTWTRTKNPYSVDPADANAEKNIIDGNMLGGYWGQERPASSKELTISEYVTLSAVRKAVRSIATSGFNVKGAFSFSGSFAPNTFRMAVSRCMVDGLFLHVVGTILDSETDGVITLNGPPGSGTPDDLVFLEMWLAEIVGSTATTPVSTFKPSTSTVWKYGNVEFGGTNPADDINEVDFEIRRRIQIQYRIRTVPNINFTTYPLGVSAPTVLAQGSGASPTALTFVAQTYDNTLFRAGNGSVAHQASLGTVDGFVYAIPIAKVARSAGVSDILSGHVTDLRQNYGVLAFVKRAGGDALTGNYSIAGSLSIVGANLSVSNGIFQLSGTSSRSLEVTSTDNGASSLLDLKGKTGGGTITHYRAIAGPTAVGFGSISAHAAFISTADIVRLQISSSGLFSALPVGYQSSQQTITDATMLTLAHGLPGTPKQVWVTIICVISEHGFGAAEEVSIPLNNDDDGTSEKGVVVSADATNIYVQKGAAAIPVYTKASPGIGASITNSNWRFIVRANP